MKNYNFYEWQKIAKANIETDFNGDFFIIILSLSVSCWRWGYPQKSVVFVRVKKKNKHKHAHPTTKIIWKKKHTQSCLFSEKDDWI